MPLKNSAAIISNLSIRPNSGLGKLKQTLLLFDTIGLPDCIMMTSAFKSFGMEQLSREFEFLIHQGLIFDPFLILPEVISENKDRATFDILTKELQNDQPNKNDDVLIRIYSWAVNNSSLGEKLDSIPIVQNIAARSEIPATKSDIVNLIIKDIPIPDESTPWEAIFDFKNDEDNLGRLADLRDWINETIRSNYNVSEINDKIEHLMFKYKKGLKNHKIKYYSGILQAILFGPLEMLANAVRLKFSDITKPLFDISEAKADLMNFELNAAGNELAYIYQAKNKFGPEKG